MPTRRGYLVMAFAVGAAPLVLISAPQAAADCTVSNGVSVCAQGTVRGPDGGTGPGPGPYTPYPCNYDYLCDAGLSIELGPPDWHPDRPWHPGGGGGGGGGGIGPRH